MSRISMMSWLFFLFMSFSFGVSARSFHDVLLSLEWRPVVTLSVGGSDARNMARTQTLSANSESAIYAFTPHQPSSPQPLLGAYASFEHPLSENKFLQLGVSYFQPYTSKVLGNVSSTSASQPLALYRYTVNLQQLLAESKFIYKMGRYMPYLATGLGVGWIETGSFSSTLPTKLSLGSSTTSNLSFGVETGVDITCSLRVCLGFGYRFMYFGKYETKSGHTKIFSELGSLNAPHIYANALIVHLRFT